jgi:hypothetical protein
VRALLGAFASKYGCEEMKERGRKLEVKMRKRGRGEERVSERKRKEAYCHCFLRGFVQRVKVHVILINI